MTETGMVDRAAHGAEDRRGHHLIWGFIALAVFGLAVLTVAFFSYRAASTDEIRSLGDRADDNAAVANRLADQVEQLGGTPVVEPPAQGEPGAKGDQGDQGSTGERGPKGDKGDPGGRGPAGTNGSNGTNGTSGTNGQDGVTPPCMAEPTQCRGADGEDGTDGQDGAQGPPGPTCPSGYSPASRTYDPTPLIAGDEETWWVCVADGGQS